MIQGGDARGGDNIGVENFPSPEPDNWVRAHTYLQAERGVSLIEVLWLEDLAQDRVYEFALIVVPLELRGAPASPVRPVALPIRPRESRADDDCRRFGRVIRGRGRRGSSVSHHD